MKNKMRTSKKANMSYTEGKVYYCNLSERYIREQAVRELIEKQNKKGTIEDWLKPYREEYEQISRFWVGSGMRSATRGQPSYNCQLREKMTF